MTQVVNHKGKRLKVGPRGGGLPYIYIYILHRYMYIPSPSPPRRGRCCKEGAAGASSRLWTAAVAGKKPSGAFDLGRAQGVSGFRVLLGLELRI